MRVTQPLSALGNCHHTSTLSSCNSASQKHKTLHLAVLKVLEHPSPPPTCAAAILITGILQVTSYIAISYLSMRTSSSL